MDKRRDEKILLELHRGKEDWLTAQPGVARSGVELSTRTGRPTLTVYTREMPPRVRRDIERKLSDVPVEFKEVRPDEEVVPYAP